jgi:hypothetical protein
MDHHQVAALTFSIMRLISCGHVIRLGSVNLRAKSDACFRVWTEDDGNAEEYESAALAAQAFTQHCKRRNLAPYGLMPPR